MRQVMGMERNTHLVGQSTSFLDAVERASRAAPLDRPVLVIVRSHIGYGSPNKQDSSAAHG